MTTIYSSTETYASIDDLSVALSDGVLSVTMNRPDSLNSLTSAMLAGIADAMEQASTDSRVKVVRLGGAGRGFSSGAGISAEDQATSGAIPAAVLDAANRAVGSIVALPKPVVAVCRVRPPASASPWRWRVMSYWLRRRRFSCWPSPRLG
jgi:enoyl-CoA hydratase